jgi:hypothetical protein
MALFSLRGSQSPWQGESVLEAGRGEQLLGPFECFSTSDQSKRYMRLILQFPFLHEKVVHGLCHEKVRVCGATKICLKPDGDLSLTFRVGIGGRNDIFASLTNIWLGPRLSARILYPKLCQSMMTLLPRNLPTSHTKARVGMLGGFFAILLY